MKTKTIKAKCEKCGVIDLDIDAPFTEGDEQGFIITTAKCPTMRSLSMFYKRFVGESYEKSTGNKVKDDFEKTYLVLNHCNPDEDGETWKEHKLKPIECWRLTM